jgi:tRNA modification GTPase
MRSSDPALDTIVALATPAGRSALAVVRLSGPLSAAILARLAPGLPPAPEPRRPHLSIFCDLEAATIDTGVATLFSAPASATGEDVAEISVHGSPVAVERLLAAAVGAGARPARPGEFTERAFRAGKIDLVRAEAVRDLIDAKTPAAARASARRLAGALSQRIERVREDLLHASAGLEAVIDFSEDVGEGVPPAVSQSIASVIAELEKLASTADRGRLLAHGCRVAILGPPNAGKSTLYNALVGSARAIVTEIPGTTRDALEALVDVRGIPVTLVDTAGLRPTEDVVEKIGVARAREEGERADALLYVFDASAGFGAEDAATLAKLTSADRPYAVIANKADLAVKAPVPSGSVLVCGLDPETGEALKDLLGRTLGAGVRTEETSEVLGSLRQRDLVARALAGARQTLEALGDGSSPEYAATHCHAALDALADLVGETTSDDVLARVFETFCVGK